MLTRTAFALVLILATASGSLAATKHHNAPAPAVAAPIQNAYGPSNPGTDPDPAIRFELQRDWSHGRY
jgi:hypothetical protein